MTPTRFVLAGLAVLALFVGTAAAVPTDSALSQAEAADGAGLPEDVPGPISDFVGHILDTIGTFLDGVLDGMPGSAVNDEAGDDTATEDVNGS